MAIPMKPIKRLLMCKLTPAERQQKGEDLAKKLQEINSETLALASLNATGKAKIKKLNTEAGDLVLVVSRGEEMRQVDVESYFDPELNLIIETRVDTMEVVNRRVPEVNERQMTIDDAIRKNAQEEADKEQVMKEEAESNGNPGRSMRKWKMTGRRRRPPRVMVYPVNPRRYRHRAAMPELMPIRPRPATSRRLLLKRS